MNAIHFPTVTLDTPEDVAGVFVLQGDSGQGSMTVDLVIGCHAGHCALSAFEGGRRFMLMLIPMPVDSPEDGARVVSAQ